MTITSGCFLVAFVFSIVAAVAANRARLNVPHIEGQAWSNKVASSTFIAAMHIPVALTAFGLGRLYS